MILGKVWDEPPKLPIIHGELGLSFSGCSESGPRAFHFHSVLHNVSWQAWCNTSAGPFKMVPGKVWDEPPGELGLSFSCFFQCFLDLCRTDVQSLGPVPSTAFFSMSPGRLGATPRPAHC